MKKIFIILTIALGSVTSCGMHALDDPLSPAMLALDLDSDLVFNGTDNCPMVYNPGQGDLDFDGIGDICDINTDYVNNSITAIYKIIR